MPIVPIMGSLILISFLGMRESKNIHNIRDFAFSKGSFSTLTLVTTIVASFIGGGVVIGTAEKSYTMGLAPIFGLLGFALQLLLTGFLVAKRVYRFDSYSSIGALINRNYGKGSNLIVGVCWMLFCVGLLSAQMVALGRVLSLFVPIAPALNNLLASSFLIFYCLLGGIRAVVLTDRMQFWLIVTIVPTILAYLISLFYKSGFILHDISHSFLFPVEHMRGMEITSLFLGFLLGDALIPPLIQRIQLAKNYLQAKNAFIISSAIVLVFTFICGGLGIFLHILKPDLDPSLLIQTLFNEFLPMPAQILGAIALVAVIMSSADSYLNSLAFVFVSDVFQPLRRKKLSDQNALYLARFATLFFGFLSFGLSIFGKNSYDLLLQTYKFWGPIMFAPILFALWNRPISKRGFYITIFSSITSVILWDFFKLESVTQMSSLPIGIFSSLLVYCTHLYVKEKPRAILNRGF